MIRIFLTILLSSIIISQSDAQEVSSKNASKAYLAEVISFLSEVKKELNNPSFSLVTAPKYFCFASVIQDSVTFSIDELEQIKAQINSPKIKNWKSVLPFNIRFFKQNKVDALLKNVNADNEVATYKANFGGSFYNFSAPIFLKNNTVCLFYADQMLPTGGSHGELQVYQKQNGTWKQMMTPCEWVE